MPVGYGGVLGGMINTQEALANIEQTRLQTQLMGMKLQQDREAAERESEARLGLMNEAQRQMAAEQQNAPVMGISEDVTPASMALAEMGMDKPALSSEMALAPMGKPQKLSDVLQKEYESALGFAKAAAASGDIKTHVAYKKEAENVLAKKTEALNKERVEQKEQFDRIRQYLGAVRDQTSFDDMVRSTREEYPNFPIMMKQMGFTPDGKGGFIYDEAAKAKIAVAQDMITTRAQRLADEDRDVERQRKADADRAREQDKETLREIQKSNAQARQAQIEAKAAQEEQKRVDAKNRQKELITNRVQSSLDKDPLYGQFSRYEQAQDLAENMIAKLEAGTYSERIDASQIDSLIASYNQMKDGFRPRSGGKYQLEEVSRFNGMVQKLETWWKTLGRGTNRLSESEAKNVANQMRELHSLANKAAVVVSFEGREQLYDRLRNAGIKDKEDLELAKDAIRLKGTIQTLQKYGQIREVERNGKVYIDIGSKDKFLSFEKEKVW